MIRKVDMYQCVCDGCGKAYEDEDRGFCAWVDERYATDAAYEDDWTEIDGKHYCPDCYDYDEEKDEYMPKKKEQ